MQNPKITVLMTLFNGEKYLREAIESILNQTYKDFEFLIINDASTDSSKDIILSYNDSRIRLIDNEENIGFVASLNKGLWLAKGDYIARMDADDLSMPQRLEKQLIFMEEQQEVGLLGCWVDIINENGNNLKIWKAPQSHGYIKWLLLTRNCITHSAAFYRVEIARKLRGYREQFIHAEDYDLWSRMSSETKIYQIPEVLVKWRKHSLGICVKFFDEQEKTASLVTREAMSRMLEKDASAQQIDDFLIALKKVEMQDIGCMFNFLLNLFKVYKKKVVISEYEKRLIVYDLIQKMNEIYEKNKTIHSIEAKKAFGIAMISDKDIICIYICKKMNLLKDIITKELKNFAQIQNYI